MGILPRLLETRALTGYYHEDNFKAKSFLSMLLGDVRSLPDREEQDGLRHDGPCDRTFSIRRSGWDAGRFTEAVRGASFPDSAVPMVRTILVSR